MGEHQQVKAVEESDQHRHKPAGPGLPDSPQFPGVSGDQAILIDLLGQAIAGSVGDVAPA
ncbi:hypothetical protein D3C85_1617070 [compost metagenome]